MDAVTVSHALRNIVAGMAELALIIVALLAVASGIMLWLNRERRRVAKEKITRGFPTPKHERALEAANRTPVIIPKPKT